MPIGALLLLLAAAFTSACGGLDFFQQYEYEEDLYLSLDGSATVYVNSSIPALNALRGASFDTNPSVPVDRDAVKAFFTTPRTRVTRVAVSRRANRRFVHVRLAVDDVRQMGGTAPFGWSSYRFNKEGELFVYRQSVGSSAAKSVGEVGWKGEEVVAFRLHPPSRVVYHNAGADNLKRGNILVWEQRFDARTRGEPLTLDARMESQSILYRTLILFGGTVAAVGVGFFVLLWLIMRRGHRAAGRASRPEGAANSSDPRREASVR